MFRVSAMYVVVCWLSMQVIAVMTPALHLPDWVDSFIAVLFIAGFPISMLIAWAFEITPDGIVRSESVPKEQSIRELTGRRMDYLLFLGLLFVGGLIVYDRMVPEKPQNLADIPTSTVTESSARDQIGSVATIAVLPFADISQGQDQKYFSDGIAEEILNLLVRVDDLQVISRTLSFSFDTGAENLDTISERYNISHFLDGSVRKEGDDVRINVALIDADTNLQSWSKTYADQIESIFSLQEDIARSVVGELKIALDVDSERDISTAVTENLQSYDLYLEGRNLFRTGFSETDVLNAIGMLEQAVALDPDFAEAWGFLGQAYLSAPGRIGSLDVAEYLSQSEAAITMAISLDPKLSYTYGTLGMIQSIRGDQTTAIKTLKTGFDLNPDDDLVLANMGLIYTVAGRADLAEPHLERAAILDPDRPPFLSLVAMAKRNLGKFDESDEYAQKAADTGYIIAYDILARNAFSRGDAKKATELFMLLPEKGGAQLSSDFRAPGLWEAGTRAYFEGSETDLNALQSLFTIYLSGENAVVNGFLVTSLLRVGLTDLFFEKVNDALGSSTFALSAIWDDTKESRAARQSQAFSDFAKRHGYIEFWNEVGWPSNCRQDGGNVRCDEN